MTAINLRFFGLFFLFILGALPKVSAQDTYEYRGPLTIGSYQGITQMSYVRSDGDSLLNGAFTFNSADLNALLESGDRYFSIQGNFIQNVPSGYWQFEFGDFQSGSKAVLRDNEYRVPVNGTNHTARGRITGGKPDGTWNHTVHVLEDSKVTETRFESTIEFSRGVPQFSFKIRNDAQTLVGRFLRDGLAHDRWELFGGTRERWQFNNGVLEEIYVEEGNLTRRIDVFPKTMPESVIINLDQRFMNLLALKRRLLIGSDSTFSSDIFKMLEANAHYYAQVEEILSEITPSEFSPEYKVKVPYYPLSENEMVQLDSIQKMTHRSTTTVDGILEDTQLQLLKLTDSEVAYLLATAEEINEQLVTPLEMLSAYTDQDVVAFVSRSELLNMLNLTVAPDQTLEVTVEDGDTPQEYTLASAEGWQGTNTSLDNAYKTAQVSDYSLAEINAALQEKLSLKQREETLAGLETDLIDAMKRLTDQTDSLTASVSPGIAGTINHVEDVAEENLKEYSQLTDISEKVQRASELVSCFDDLYELNEVVAGLPGDQEAIAELYSDAVWNPFTLTVMDEDIKKRITAAYRDVLIPYVLNNINTNLQCGEVCSHIKLIEAIHLRMEELLEEDTSKLERKLKREQDPQIVLELFEVTENI